MSQEKAKFQKLPIPDSTVELVRGIGKNSGKPYKAILVTAGEWSNMFFIESQFEMAYIEKLALANDKQKVHDDTHIPDSTPKETISLDDEDDSNDWINNL